MELRSDQIQELEENSEAYYNFIDGLKAEFSKKAYLIRLRLFLRFCHLQRYDSLLTLTTEQLRDKIIQYFVERKNGVSRATQQLDQAAIKHFCEINDTVLNWKKIGKFVSSDKPRNIGRGYTREEKEDYRLFRS